MRTFVVVYAGMLLVAALVGRLAGVPSLFTRPPTGAGLAAWCAAGALVGLGVVLACRPLEAQPRFRRMALRLRELVSRVLGPDLARPALVVALYSSVGEEALFRGVLQPWLVLRLGDALGPSAVTTALGVVLATLAFALTHASRDEDLRPYPAFAAVVGALCGALAAASGTLAPAVVAHFVVNWLNLRRLATLS